MSRASETKTEQIYAHTIEYYWLDDEKEDRELNEVDIEHISNLLKDGFTSGELNQYDHDTDEEVRGWWSIAD